MRKLRIVSLIMAVAILFSMSAFALEISVEEDMILVSEIQRQENAMNVYSAKVQEINSSLRIDKVKKLCDFAGNEYTLIECFPVGYFVFHNESGIFREFSDSAMSPYMDCDNTDTLIYGGPTFYYVLEDDNYIHTVSNEELSTENNELYAQKSNNDNTILLNNKNEVVCEYINSNTSKSNVPSFGLSTASSTAGYSYIPNADFFYSDNDDEFGYVDDGYCGYIAANLILRYWDDCGEISLSNTYTSTSGVEDSELTYDLIIIGEDLGYSSGSYPWQIKNVLEEFCDQKNISASVSYLLAGTGVTSELDDDRPVIVFGSLSPSSSTNTSSHAVTAYGYYLDSSGFEYHIAHFGWSGYEQAYIYGTYGGSTMFEP